jgi:hypothetical protein
MTLTINGKTYRASQLEKAMLAISEATGDGHVSVAYTRPVGHTNHTWRALIDCRRAEVARTGKSPFAALCKAWVAMQRGEDDCDETL